MLANFVSSVMTYKEHLEKDLNKSPTCALAIKELCSSLCTQSVEYGFNLLSISDLGTLGTMFGFKKKMHYG